VGSHARGTATDASDVDLVVLANDPQRYLQDRSWVETLGEVVRQDVEQYGNVVSLRVHSQDQFEVEFGLTYPHWAAGPLDPGTQEVVAAGMKVLFERGPLLSGMLAACYSSPMGPVDALYENGLLRPVSPLPLRPGERVAVIVVRKADPARWDLTRLAAHGDDDLALAEAGLDEWAAALDREDRG